MAGSDQLLSGGGQTQSLDRSGSYVGFRPIADVRRTAKLHPMGALFRKILGVIDSLISGGDLRFWRNFHWMIWLPTYPFLVPIFFVETPSAVADILFAATMVMLVLSAAFLLRRRTALKHKL